MVRRGQALMHGYWDRHARQTNEDPVNPPHLQAGPCGPTIFHGWHSPDLPQTETESHGAVTIADQHGRTISHGNSRWFRAPLLAGQNENAGLFQA